MHDLTSSVFRCPAKDQWQGLVKLMVHSRLESSEQTSSEDDSIYQYVYIFLDLGRRDSVVMDSLQLK